MALAKERITQVPESSSHMGLLQACSLYPVHDPSSTGLSFEEDEEEGSLESKIGALKDFSVVGDRLPPLSDPVISINASNNFMFRTASTSSPGEAQYVIDFKSGYENSEHFSASLLSFENGEQEQEYPVWGDHEELNYQWNINQAGPISYGADSSRLSDDLNSIETASTYGSSMKKDTHVGEERLIGWLSSGGECFEESRSADQLNSHKRPRMGTEIQASKKHCAGGSTKKPKPKSIPPKDPQSIAAKNRRERISERLKILQELVPNGAKVDLVTMLEKAISYVKFLQLQVKVLATDEFWPAQGGKAPEASQVKEALDAILSSNKDRNSSSK